MKIELVNMLMHFTHDDADALGCAMVGEYLNITLNTLQRVVFNAMYMVDKNVRYFAELCLEVGREEPNIEAVEALSELLYANKDVYKSFAENTFELPYLVWVTDVGISQATCDALEQLEGYGIKILYVDHHQANKALHQYKKWCYVETTSDKSMQKAACEYLLKKTIMAPENFSILRKISPVQMKILQGLIKDISRYDTWNWKLNPIEPMQEYHTYALIQLYGSVTEAWKVFRTYLIHRIPKDYYELMGMEGMNFTLYHETLPAFMVLINAYNAIVNAVVDRAVKRYVVVKGYKLVDFGVCVNPQYEKAKIALLPKSDSMGVNDVMDYIGNNANVDLVMMMYPDTMSVSFRCAKNHKIKINMNKFAGFFGGGGHADAAGAKLEPDKFKMLMDLYYDQYAIQHARTTTK